MNTITAINGIRDSLRTNLTDPWVTAGGSARASSSWIIGDEPTLSPRYPQIQILKLDNPTEVMDIGYAYTEFEQLFLNLTFRNKNGFKITVGGVEYCNASLTEYYLGLIKTTLKAQASTLHNAGYIGYKHLNTTPIGYDEDSQLYFGTLSIRIFYFNR